MRHTTIPALTAAAALFVAVLTAAGCGSAAHPATATGPCGASCPAPQATDASQVVTHDGYKFAWTQERGGLSGPYPGLYGAGHIDNAATGFKPSADGLEVNSGAELFVITRTPADAAALASQMQATVDAIDGANPFPSPFRLALVYLPADHDRATAGPLNVRVIGSEAALRYFLAQWSPDPAALLPPTVPASPAPASSVPAANTSGCPSSAQLMAAWDAASAAARRSWTPLVPSGMSDITCWRTWAVASPIVNANGLVVFYQQGGQWHLLPQTQLSQFDTAVCDIPGAPAKWSSPAEGPATCS
jgi:hypothetical protein